MRFFLVPFIFYTINSFADITGYKLPPIPDDCFSTKNYCHFSTFERERDYDGERSITIYVNFFAKLNADEYGNLEDLQNRFTDFSAWERYIQKSKNVRIKYSRKLADTQTADGQLILHHICDYEMRRPFGWEHIIEKSDYVRIPTAPGALVSLKFTLDRSYPGTIGIEDKTGIIHVAFDEESNNYNIYVQLEVKPTIKILPQVGAEVTERGLVDIFLGMFDLL